MTFALTHSTPSNGLLVAVRTHFGLTQVELARYLGISPQQMAHLEAGRRRATPATTLRLIRLARLLPPPEGFGPAAPAAAYAPPAEPLVLFGAGLHLPGPLALAVLQKRQRQTGRRLVLLRRDLYVLTTRTRVLERRRWALTVLETALVPHPTDPAAGTPTEQDHLRRWLAELAATLPPPPVLRPDTATAVALLLVRLAATEAEAATLAQLIARQT